MNFMVCFRLALLAIATLSCASIPAVATPHPAKVPRSIILIIGDGMGAAHFTAARILRASDFQTGRFPVVGLVATQSANSLVTDSAASATAYATGFKTNDGMIAVDPAGNPLRTVLEMAEARGMATGLVTTTAFWDATPAAFAAHALHRREAIPIARQMLRSGVDVIASTGAEKLGVDGWPALDTLAAEGGYSLVRTAEELQQVQGPAAVLAVFRSSEHDVDSPDIRLPAMAQWAIERLSKDPDGFFLLLEHEGTDSASHNAAAPQVEASLHSFDETVGVALEFAGRKNDVLVIVTGDHETGGLQILGQAGQPLQMKFTTGGHTGEAIPIFSKGPGAEGFSGFLDNTDVGKKLLSLVAKMGSKR